MTALAAVADFPAVTEAVCVLTESERANVVRRLAERAANTDALAEETLLYLVHAWHPDWSPEVATSAVEDAVYRVARLSEFHLDPDVAALVGETGTWEDAEQLLLAELDRAVHYCAGGAR